MSQVVSPVLCRDVCARGVARRWLASCLISCDARRDAAARDTSILPVSKSVCIIVLSDSLPCPHIPPPRRCCQVACGACHTLVLLDKKLWVLGSGLDLQSRVSNLKVSPRPLCTHTLLCAPTSRGDPRALEKESLLLTFIIIGKGPFPGENHPKWCCIGEQGPRIAVCTPTDIGTAGTRSSQRLSRNCTLKTGMV